MLVHSPIRGKPIKIDAKGVCRAGYVMLGSQLTPSSEC